MPKMTDDAIVARLAASAGQAVGLENSKLVRERERVRRFYEGEWPRKVSEGDSNYVSRETYASVEAMRAQLLETFSATHRPAVFVAGPTEDLTVAQTKTDWCADVLYTQNDGFAILSTAIEDGLMNRAGIVKVFWHDDHRTVAYDLTDTTVQELEAHLGHNPDVDIEDYTVDEPTGALKRVRLTRKVDQSYVKIEPVPPEEFGISPQAKSIAEAECVFHKRRMTLSELRRLGYPAAKIDALPADDRAWDVDDTDQYVRFEDTDDILADDSLASGDNSRRRAIVIEAYAQFDMDGTGISSLWKVTFSGSTLLDKEQCERKPFVAFVPLPRAHAFWGDNFAELTIPTQTANTYLTRSIINHALITNNPRLMVQQGTLQNPRELMENRLGGLVNVKNIEGIAPIPQQGLNPFVFQTLQMLGENKEDLTGISKLSQGLNKDAISSQNSASMVDQLITNSQTRQRIIARNFAERFFRPLINLIYRVSLENETQAKFVEVAGTWTPIDFTTWAENSQVKIAMALSASEQDAEVTKWFTLHKALSTDPVLKDYYPREKAYLPLTQALQASGIRNVNSIVLTPDKLPPPPPPTPMEQADLAMKQAEAAVKNASAQATTAKAQTEQAMLSMKAQEAQAKAQLEATKLQTAMEKEADHTNLAADKADLARDQFAHEVAMDSAELRLQVQALEQQKLTAVAAPKG